MPAIAQAGRYRGRCIVASGADSGTVAGCRGCEDCRTVGQGVFRLKPSGIVAGCAIRMPGNAANSNQPTRSVGLAYGGAIFPQSVAPKKDKMASEQRSSAEIWQTAVRPRSRQYFHSAEPSEPLSLVFAPAITTRETEDRVLHGDPT